MNAGATRRLPATPWLIAETDTRFVLGAAVPHPHPLVMGMYSVHTSADALAHGEAEIRRLRPGLRAAGQPG